MRLLEALLVVASLAGCTTGAGKEAVNKGNYLSAEGRTNVGLAQGYLEQGQIDKAKARADKAMSSDPGSADVHALFALIYTRTDKIDKAEREFPRALQIAPDDGTILNAHASWLCERGQPAQADAEFIHALQDRNYKSPHQALSNAGKCAYKTGQWSKAEGYFRRTLALAPEDRAVLLLLAETELRQGKIMEAQAFVQRRDGLGKDAETLALAARIEDAANNPLLAARYRQRLKDEFPNYVPTGEGARTP